MKRSKVRRKTRSYSKTVKDISLILAGLVLLLVLIYYVRYGVGGGAAFEQLPRSLAYYQVDQSGVPQVDKYGSFGVHYVKPGDTVDMWVTVKNLSRNPQANVWYPKSDLPDEGPDYPNAHAIGVGVVNDASPFWLDSSSFVINGNRFAYYDGPPVYRGKYMTVAWRVKVANNAVLGSAYPLEISLVRELDEWGIRTTGTGGDSAVQAMRWVFKVSNVDIYPANPAKTLSNYNGRLVYQDTINALTERLISYDLNTGQTQQLFQRTRADYYSPTIYTRLVEPISEIFWVGQTMNDQWGYGDKWFVFANPILQFFSGVTSIPVVGELKESNWWDASTCLVGTQDIVAAEKYVSSGITLYNYSNEDDDLGEFIGSYMPRLSWSPWDPAKFSGYAKKIWLPDCTRLYLGRCNADDRGTCDQGLSTWQFDQMTFVNSTTPPTFDLNLFLTQQRFNTIDFSPELNYSSGFVINPNVNNLGMAVGSTYSLRNNMPVPPSEMKSVSLNSGTVQSLAKSILGAYTVEKVSTDGTWIMYTIQNATGAVTDEKKPRDKKVAFISRVGDVYQPIVVAQDFDDIKVLGWTKDNRYIGYIEYKKCGSAGCQNQLKVFDTQNRSYFIPAIPSGALPIAVI